MKSDLLAEFQLLKPMRQEAMRLPVIQGKFKRRWSSGVPYEVLKIRGERRISGWVDDSFFSLDGRFAVISRDEHVEHGTPMRLRCPGIDLHRVELWVDGKIVAKCKCLALAINWILLKCGTLKVESNASIAV